jgi:glycosyltransferase domain-containing protein
MVNSTYSVVCGDDDYVVPAAIEKCVAFLNSNPDFDCAHGCVLGLYAVEPEDHGRIVGWRALDSSTPRNSIRLRRQTQTTIDDPDASIRLRQHLLHYESTFYSVNRRTKLIRQMHLASDLTNDFFFGELLPSCLGVIQGKVKYLEILYNVRPYHSPDLATKFALRLDLPAMIVSDDYSKKYVRFRNCLAEELSTVSGKPLKESSRVIDHIFAEYIAYYLESYFAIQGYESGFQRTTRRFWKTLRAVPELIRSAFLEGQLFSILSSPRQSVRMVSALSASHGYMRLDQCPRSYQKGFLPIWESVLRYPSSVQSI